MWPLKASHPAPLGGVTANKRAAQGGPSRSHYAAQSNKIHQVEHRICVASLVHRPAQTGGALYITTTFVRAGAIIAGGVAAEWSRTSSGSCGFHCHSLSWFGHADDAQIITRRNRSGAKRAEGLQRNFEPPGAGRLARPLGQDTWVKIPRGAVNLGLSPYVADARRHGPHTRAARTRR